ncbi:MAG: DUF87 domain-containing protein [Anaerolineales bacterium]|nr:DUF87 domain-containing protein [Anaerolineales bacterium]
MTAVTLGQGQAGPLHIDVPTLIDSRQVITASSGGGKSWLLRRLIEQIARQVQVIVIDPEGEFNTLREKFDMLLVGSGGEVAAEARTARKLAAKLSELRVSAIIDLYDLGDWDARRAFLAPFIDGLMNTPKSGYHPIYVPIDEAHNFAPETAAGRADSPVAQSRRAVNFLMSAGRKRAVCGALATQRISKLAKDAIGDAKNVFIGGITLDVDQARAGDMLGLDKAGRLALRDLEPGEFYCFGPALGRGVHRFRTGPVVTTHPRPGQRHLLEVPPASGAIQQIVASLGDLPRVVQRETDELAAAQRRVRELEQQLRTRPVQAPLPERIVERVEIPVFKDGEVNRLESAVGQMAVIAEGLGKLGDGLLGASQALRTGAGEVGEALRAVVQRQSAALPGRRPHHAYADPAPAARPAPRPPEAPPAESDIALRAGERKMLQALAQRHPARYTVSQLGTLSGFAPRGGTFRTYFGVLKRAGLIVEQGGEVSVTEAGLAYLGAAVPPAPATTAEMLAMWRARLRAGEARMLDVLVERYPEWIAAGELGEAAGFAASGGTFRTYLGVLRRNGLAEVQGDQVRASPTLFVV